MAAALLLSFSAAAAAAVLLLARRDAIAGLVLDALDRFHLDGRSLLDLATKRNMVLLCHAILLLILRDAGILGAPARRRAASSATTASSLVVAAADAADGNEEAAVCSAPARPRATTTATATSVVVWRRPRSSARDGASADESGRRHAHARRRQPRQQPAEAAIPSRAEPALLAEPEQHPPMMISKEVVLVETKAPGNYHLGGGGHDRAAAVVGLDHQAAAWCATTTDGNKSDYDDDRRIVAVTDHDGNANAGTEEAVEVELADDRRIEEFIANQWSKMRQESLQLFRSSSGSSLQQAITA